jgi:hypothetical protein
VHPRRLKPAARVIGLTLVVAACAWAVCASTAYSQTETIRVELKLRTGGALDGLVVDHTEHGLVIVHETSPYVFAWDELESGCVYRTKRALLIFQRGGEDRLTAEDHYQLGLAMLARDRNDLAGREFRVARRLNRKYEPLVKSAFDDYRRRKDSSNEDDLAPFEDTGAPAETVEEVREPGLVERIEAAFADRDGATVVTSPSQDRRKQVLEVYRNFGRKVQEVISRQIVLVESDHFLIFTDWEPRYRDRLAGWCEAMYAAICQHFDLDPNDDVFLAKCPVFCWRSKPRFRKFARLFDGYDGTGAIGYTRSIQENGHVHLVLLRQGRTEADFDRLACTLVHEGTHAFLHRLWTTRLIPHWVNEGYADLVAERVLRDRCPNRENAELLARQFVRYDWPVTKLLHSTGPIEVHQYPLAHSVIAYLERLDRTALAGFIRDLKSGMTVAAALAARYDNLTIDELEARWRSAIRATDPLPHPSEPDAAVLPWSNNP